MNKEAYFLLTNYSFARLQIEILPNQQLTQFTRLRALILRIMSLEITRLNNHIHCPLCTMGLHTLNHRFETTQLLRPRLTKSQIAAR